SRNSRQDVDSRLTAGRLGLNAHQPRHRQSEAERDAKIHSAHMPLSWTLSTTIVGDVEHGVRRPDHSSARPANWNRRHDIGIPYWTAGANCWFRRRSST